MGIETAPLDVEESTEPPICVYSQEHQSQHHSHPRDVKDAHDIEKAAYPEGQAQLQDKAEQITPVCHTVQDLPSSADHAHTLGPSSLSGILDVDLQHGLSNDEASSRLVRYGPNSVREMEGLSVWKIFLRQVSNSLTLILVIVMGVSFGIDDYIEGGVITAVILLNIVVGFVQDYRAEKDILSLQRLSAPICKVLRDGRITSVKAESLVVGDIVQLAVGDIVPADMRLFEGMNASMDEALLTGESLPVAKTPHTTLTSRDIPIGDRTNMAYSGCSTTQGRAIGVVTATGMMTEVGKIAQLLQDKAEHDGSNLFVRMLRRLVATVKSILGLVGTPLQIKLSKFALLLFALAIMLAIIVFSVNKWDIQGEVLIYGICVAVAVVPESLIAVLTITVAVGTKAMARGNVIVRKLQCLEAVGGVTNICSDKTGTLTQGKMVARTAWIPDTGTLTVHDTTNPFDPTSGLIRLDGKDSDPKDVQDSASNIFLTALSLCNLSIVHNNAQFSDNVPTQRAEGEWTAVGEPTEIALRVFSMRFGHNKPDIVRDRDLHLHTEYPFDSSVKRMTVVYANHQTRLNEVYSKGAPEALITSLDISDQEKEIIQETAETMAAEGLRVLCIAYKSSPINDESQVSPRSKAESNLRFGGLVGLYDPPRLETAAAVRKCQMAGITVHMLTGDHIRTATAIASEVGILDAIVDAKSSRLVMAAKEFDRLSDADIDSIEQLPLVIARCSPATKVRMVEAMHRRGAFCVMTGDGVNDSPALKHADVGIAMGKNGSDVAKEAADMVLTDDNFASIVKAVEEGRRLFDNIQKAGFLMHLLISNIAQVILLLIALAFKDEEGNSIFPLSPLEILWANLVTSSFLALGLGLEEAQPDIMFRPPHDLKVGVFTRELITDKMVYGTFMGSLCLVAFVSVIYGAGSGTASMGRDCNDGWNGSCGTVFEARATTYATLTFLLLVTAWEVKHFSRSLFNLNPDRYPGKLSVFNSIWQNQFLFWAVIAGFVIAFPVIYLPEVNRVVFKHQGISWHWGIVFGCVVVYLALVESWKATKRRFGIGTGKNATLTMDDAEMRAGLTILSPISLSANASVDATSIRSRLTDLNLDFDFLDGPYPCSPAPGIDLFYPPPYYTYYPETLQNATIDTLKTTHTWLSDIIAQRGPYDLVMTFSQGAALAASMLLLHEVEVQRESQSRQKHGNGAADGWNPPPPPFKSAIFICGGAPIPLLEYIGYTISPSTKARDLASTAALASMADSSAILSRGSSRWTANGLDMTFPNPYPSHNPTYNHIPLNSLQLVFHKEEDIRHEICGRIKIRVPTVHIYGERDPRYIAGIQLSEVCEQATRKMYNHGGGHDIPRFEAVSGAIGDLVRWAVRAAEARG
ncbi:hypothetical protein BJX76DRAFT_362687 [Aspergillus varians]